MLRIAVISSLLLAACEVGEISGVIPDGGGGGDSGSGSDCEPIAAAPPAGNHNAGMGCRTAAACHNAQLGLGGPEFSVAGTLYMDTAGTMPYAGGTVIVTIGGMTRKAIAADNGNFWFDPLLLPAPSATMTGTTSASACPNTAVMVGALVGGGGDCNNCHRNGGTTLPIYVLP